MGATAGAPLGRCPDKALLRSRTPWEVVSPSSRMREPAPTRAAPTLTPSPTPPPAKHGRRTKRSNRSVIGKSSLVGGLIAMSAERPLLRISAGTFGAGATLRAPAAKDARCFDGFFVTTSLPSPRHVMPGGAKESRRLPPVRASASFSESLPRFVYDCQARARSSSSCATSLCRRSASSCPLPRMASNEEKRCSGSESVTYEAACFTPSMTPS
mmetsp:Transcript_94617/g.273589  ORF Transcript_94617/g.273589 Transcript_94617/m.273589 type:complete len:213 (+) Transcript_94617:468-1106(+)